MNNNLPLDKQDIDNINSLEINKYWIKDTSPCPECHKKQLYYAHYPYGFDDYYTVFKCQNCGFEGGD